QLVPPVLVFRSSVGHVDRCKQLPEYRIVLPPPESHQRQERIPALDLTWNWPLRPSPRKRSIQDDLLHALRILRRVPHRNGSALRDTKQCHLLGFHLRGKPLEILQPRFE